VSPLFLLYGELFVLLFYALQFMSCHCIDTACIVIIG
jgi:hypothetical protein